MDSVKLINGMNMHNQVTEDRGLLLMLDMIKAINELLTSWVIQSFQDGTK